MTDLSDLLDSRMDERIMHAINDLDFDGFKSLISELLGGIGVKITRMDASEDAVFFEGVSEDGKYFVVASRLFDNASVESMKVLKEMAGKRDATPVLVVTCDLDDEAKKFAEDEGISYADKSKLLMLLRKYDLAGKMMAELDRSILEKDRNRYLPSGAQFDSFYNLAEEHFKQRRYRDAIYNYDRALDIKPNNDIVWLRKANVFLAMGRYEDALVACKRASELRPGDATTWYLMGLAYNQLGDFEKELKAYDTALKIQPRMEAALLNRGATLFQLRRYDWALKVYEDMCNFFPKDAMAFNNRGIVLKAMGRHKEALESFDRASFLNRNYIDPVINRALTLVGMGLVTEAIEAWTNALQIDRERADIWFSLGMSQKTAGMLEEAIRSFDTAASLDKDLGEAVTQRDEIQAAITMANREPVPAEVEGLTAEIAPEAGPEEAPEPIETKETMPEPEVEEIAPVQPEIMAPEEVQIPESAADEIIETAIAAEEVTEPPEREIEAEETIANPEEVLAEAPVEAIPLPLEEHFLEIEEAPEPLPADEEPSENGIEAEETIVTPEDVLAEAPAETAPLSIEAPALAVEEIHEPLPAVEEPSIPALADTDVALAVKSPSIIDIQKVEGSVSVVAVEPACLPAVRDDQRGLAVQGERELPVPMADGKAISVIPKEVTAPAQIAPECDVMVPPTAEICVIEPSPVIVQEVGLPSVIDKETAIAVRSDEVPALAITAAKSEVMVPPTADIPVAEAPSIIVQAVPLSEVMPIPPEPVIEIPAEPEIPINDRELKAALILNILGENARALEEIDLYIREKSESHDARHVKANILDDMGRLPECLEELKEAIRLDPKDEIALMDIESISRRLGRKEESMRILALLTPSKEVKAREAVSLLDTKRYDEIISRFSSLGPLDSLVTRMSLATALMAKAKYREAYRVLKEILLEHPAYPEALNNMGVCMRFMGEYGYDEPMHFMHLAVEADPNYGDAWNNIGATLFVLGDYGGAMEAIRKAVALDRRSDYLINLSKCQIMVGDIAGAKLSLTSALKYEETAEIDFALGLIAEKEGEMKWALKLYESAIELHPNFKDALFNKQRVRLFLKYTQK